MRRFSQRNSLVTLNDINITPLLDLAFVLLVIFIITRPLLEQSMDMKLPNVGKQPDRKDQVDKKDVRTVEIGLKGDYRLGGRAITLAQLEQDLVRLHKQNPKTVVYIRGNEDAAWKHVAQVISICQRNGIVRVAPQTAPVNN